MTRPRPVRWVLVLGLLAAPLSGCGDDAAAQVDIVSLARADRVDPAADSDPTIAGKALSALGFDVLEASRASGDGPNIVVSPTSIGIALAMLEPGATGEARDQLRRLLRIQDPETFHGSMNALEQELEGRTARLSSDEEDPGELELRVANAAYLQKGYPLEAAYLEQVGRSYGPALHAVDFRSNPDAVARRINQFVADATADRITNLLSDGQLKPETVLTLVNALYLKASWLETFDRSETREAPFTLLDGTKKRVPLMHGTSARSSEGDGWVAAWKPYVGGVAVQFVLPDEGRFDEVAGQFDQIIADFEQRFTKGALLAVPRFETRFNTELRQAFERLDFNAAYREGNLLGIANDPRLVLSRAAHETFLAVDEEGTEAAASTALVMEAISGPPFPPVPVVLDRPFLFRIYDLETQATLFLGRILDPTS